MGKANINSLDKEAYFRDLCGEIKSQVNIPVIMVGGLRTFALMKEIIQNKVADFVVLSRPLICEPSLIEDWKINAHKKAKCISCNTCHNAVSHGKPIYCIFSAEKSEQTHKSKST